MIHASEGSFEFDESVEPTALAGLSREQKSRLSAVLDEYLRSLERGIPPARETLLAAHPDLAEMLDTYLESLVGLHDVAAAFGADETAVEAPHSPDEKRLGDFVLLGEIGRGGMGVVYEARQTSLGRRVALKVLPFAAVLDQRQIARFKNEAQAAAQLAHPNIVPVYAVGVERGVHYYAMQFIEGQPLDRAIAQLRRQAGLESSEAIASTATGSKLDGRSEDSTHLCAASETPLSKSPGGREYFETVMRLGIQAAEALHAAHSFGVVHRDIKPSNLLLDASGKLWVTDFGLARVQADAGLTQTGDVVGTRQYMSPEQAAGEAALVDQRTDIYSLGATLYELLTLRPAYARQDLAAGAPLATRAEPTRIRSLRPDAPFDLETVVSKAMALSRDERYQTAQELADDLHRLLAGQTPVARRPTLADRALKWARRHRNAVAVGALAGAAAVVALTIGMVVVVRARTRAEHDFARAERYLKQAQDTVYQLGSLSAEQLADVPGAENVRRQVLADTLAYYEQFVAQAEDNPQLRSELATTYGKIGTLYDQLGDVRPAIDAHRQAVQLLGELVAEHGDTQDESGRLRSQLAAARNNLALALGHDGRTEEAREEFARAIVLQEQLIAGEPAMAQYVSELALSHNNLGAQLRADGLNAKAATAFREAIRLGQRAATRQQKDAGSARNLAAACNNLAALVAGRSPEEAIDLYRKAAELQRGLVSWHPGDLKYQRELATTLNNLAAAQARTEALDAAVSTYQESIEIEKQVLRVAPLDRTFRHDLAVTYNNLGLTHARLKQPTDAERCFRNSLGFQQQLVAEQPADAELNSSLGGIANNLGIVRQGWGNQAEAAESFGLAIEHQKQAVAAAPGEARYRILLAKHYDNYGRALAALGRADEALAARQQAAGLNTKE